MARNADQNHRMREQRRDRMLGAAARLFASRGLAATKVSDIAAAAGMSQGLLYHYFPSKEDIYLEIVRRAFAKLNTAALELERQDLSPRKKLELAATEILHTLQTSEDFAWSSTLVSQASVSDAVPAGVTALIRRERMTPYEVVARIVRAGQQEGTVRLHDANQLALVFWTTVKGLALHRAAQGASFRAPDAAVLTSIFFESPPP